MDIQRAAELLAARSTKDFGNALKDRGDPFKDFYKSLYLSEIIAHSPYHSGLWSSLMLISTSLSVDIN